MVTFVSGYISDLSPVKDNIKLCVCIFRAWLQPLYNNQQVKNMEIIVMDEHRYFLGDIKLKFHMVYDAMRLSFLSNTEVDSCTDFNGSVHGFVWRPFKSRTDLEKEKDGKMCIQNGYRGTKLYLFDGNKALYEDEYKKVKEFRQRLFVNQPSEQSKNTATKISTASKTLQRILFVNKHPIRNIAELLDVEHGVQSVIVGTMIAIQEDEGWWYLGCRACRGKDVTGTMSLSLFNDEVQAMVGLSAYQLCEKYAKSESNGSIPTKITNLIGNKYAFKVAIDDYNVKKLLLVFTVFRFSNDQEIINSVLACATLIKDNEAISNTVSAITSLDVESQTDENTTPNEKQKINKRPAEGESGNTTMDENDPANARKRRKELMSNRKRASSNDKRSNPSVSSDAFLTVSQRPVLSNTTTNVNRTQMLPNLTKSVATRGHVWRTPKQSTNLATSPLAFRNSKTPTLENSNVSQSFILCITLNHDNSSTLGHNSSPTSCNQVTLVNQACKRRSSLSDVSNVTLKTAVVRHDKQGPKKTASTVVTPTIRPISTQTSTYEVGESSRRTKHSKRPVLQNRTPIRFNLDDDGKVRKVYCKYYGISEEYYDHGDPTFECKACHAFLWEAEAKRGNLNPVNKAYSICCKKEKVMLEKPPATPKLLLDLFLNDDGKSQNFRNNIRTYNRMFAFTSMGGKVDDSVNRRGRGPYVFCLHGQTYHNMGSLLPQEGAPSKFAQLYIYDTDNEIKNRARAFKLLFFT
nr:hypothetical protein [Tanacetum cinerariifolium]